MRALILAGRNYINFAQNSRSVSVCGTCLHPKSRDSSRSQVLKKWSWTNLKGNQRHWKKGRLGSEITSYRTSAAASSLLSSFCLRLMRALHLRSLKSKFLSILRKPELNLIQWTKKNHNINFICCFWMMMNLTPLHCQSLESYQVVKEL